MLHGRRSECDALERLLADARRSRSGVLVVRGEAGVGIWVNADKARVPAQCRDTRVPAWTYACQTVGLAVMVYRLVELDLLAVVSGLVITQVAEAWFIDRMVLLYEDMKARDPGYAGWER